MSESSEPSLTVLKVDDKGVQLEARCQDICEYSHCIFGDHEYVLILQYSLNPIFS